MLQAYYTLIITENKVSETPSHIDIYTDPPLLNT